MPVQLEPPIRPSRRTAQGGSSERQSSIPQQIQQMHEQMQAIHAANGNGNGASPLCREPSPMSSTPSARLTISLDNFEAIAKQRRRAVLNSPRSVRVCRANGITPDELMPLSPRHFADKGVLPEIAKLRYDHYEKKRQAKMDMLKAERENTPLETATSSNGTNSQERHHVDPTAMRSQSAQSMVSGGGGAYKPSARKSTMRMAEHAQRVNKQELDQHEQSEREAKLQLWEEREAKAAEAAHNRVAAKQMEALERNREVDRKAQHAARMRAEQLERKQMKATAREEQRSARMKQLRQKTALQMEAKQIDKTNKIQETRAQHEQLERDRLDSLEDKIHTDMELHIMRKEKLNDTLANVMKRKQAEAAHRQAVIERARNTQKTRELTLIESFATQEEQKEALRRQKEEEQRLINAHHILQRQQRQVQVRQKHDDVVMSMRETTAERLAQKEERASALLENMAVKRLLELEMKRLDWEDKMELVEHTKRKQQFETEKKLQIL
eukprot:PhM_4_TR18264/c0_g1_i1/m.54734